MAGSVLIGHTGLVGGTLKRQRDFDLLINSQNIETLRRGRFDLVVCAGVRAVKWLANKEPEADRAAIAQLTDVLSTIEAREFILISTIDVYPDPTLAADETLDIDGEANHAYGRHRFELEQWTRGKFATSRIVRLPALFGAGLKKNIIFDLLRGNLTTSIDPASVFQWYPLSRLNGDLEVARANDLATVNLFPAPLRTAEILHAFFPGAAVGAASAQAPCYDLRTRWSKVFGGPDGFVLDRVTVLGELAAFIAEERAGDEQ